MTVRLSKLQELEVEICFVQREIELQRKPNPILQSVLSQLRQKHAELSQSNHVTPKTVPA